MCPEATIVDLPKEVSVHTYEKHVLLHLLIVLSCSICGLAYVQKVTLDGIAQFVIDCANREERYDVLCDIYGSFTIGQLILFCEVCRVM